MKTSIQDIFDRALCLEKNQSIKIIFRSYNELNSTRVQLYNEKKNFNRPDIELFIHQEINKEKEIFNLYIGKKQPFKYKIIEEEIEDDSTE